MKQIFLVLICLSHALSLHSQETPPITNYKTSDYNAENQNWDVTQDDHRFIYAANNEGLLQFNGEQWQLYQSPNQSIPRSVLANEDRIYYGAYMEFGYFFKQQGRNDLTYVSLSDTIGDELFEDENIWHIKEFNGYIIFQSYDRIYFYNPSDESLTYVTDKNNYYRLFKTKNHLFIYKRDGAIVTIENGEELETARFREEDNVQFVLELYEDEEKLLVLTRNQGFFKIDNGKISPWNTELNQQLQNFKIFCGLQLRNKSWVLGTISNGLLFIDSRGIIRKTINIKSGLGNNTVLNLFEDEIGNLWVALDNGIDCINLTSFISEYNDFNGNIGTVYASTIYRDDLYLGTNQGLFHRKRDSDEPFKLVEGAAGQVWSLFIYDDELLCGHTDGTFLVKNYKADKVGATFGTWGFREVPNFEKTLLLGNYSGMSVLRKVNGEWVDNGKIEGFSISSRFFEINEDLTVYVNHEHKGVFRLNLDQNLSKFKDVKLIAQFKNSKGSGLAKIKDQFFYKNSVGTYTISNDSLIKVPMLSGITPKGEYLSGKLIADKSDRVWAFNNNSIAYSHKGPINDNFLIESIPIKNSLKKTTVSFENISELDNEHLLLGKTNGYLVLDMDEIKKPIPIIYLNEIEVDSFQNFAFNRYNNEHLTFKHFQNSIAFSYSVPNYSKFLEVKYQYKLDGLDKQWSKWSSESSVRFEKLKYGDYNFTVRAKIGENVSENTESFYFKIKPPLYLSKLAIASYLLSFILLLLFVHRSYKSYYKKINDKAMQENLRHLEMERIKNDQQVVRMKNEQLNKEIEAKNREVAISMMSIAKRNEVLKSLTKELEKKESIPHNDPIYKLIRKNSDPNRDWEMFKKAFDHADLDFLKRLKSKHPNLTPNNLKFCAYLRLNLTSKEIAPLLNISIKSVEVRRYRLRKKLNLVHKDNLIDYILSI
jgi:AraC family chitin signaling transcriptional activator